MRRRGLAAVGVLLLGVGVALLWWIVYGSTFANADTSWGGFAGWSAVRVSAAAALSGGAWLLALAMPRSGSHRPGSTSDAR